MRRPSASSTKPLSGLGRLLRGRGVWLALLKSCSPLSGLLADKLGRRPLLIGSGLLFAGLGVAPFFLDDIVIILATRFGLGIAAVAFSTVGATLVGDHFRPAEQPRWLEQRA
ncbi:hypothetical protein BSL82_08455 [Tardibacter chloracetimidivorans]|uniref:Major facilitator superfamily (MFS) profile domain-containing protein n=1 Tax=Tardibacter chloracetimidivorans TaxID=1921510 RepID=A0A1L3ZUP5_9SPHN|nr:hypothetical protein BSL82_08455 [Tardibacter chloracetimidivorans]